MTGFCGLLERLLKSLWDEENLLKLDNFYNDFHPNRGIYSNCVSAMDKLYNEMKKKRPGGKQLTASTPEYLELKTLWQYTGDVQSVVARHACGLLTQLLRENGAEFTYILNGFLNQVPTAKTLQGIIEGVSDLLELQILLKEGAGEKYSCPYNIRNPPHPFITVLVNRPEDSWPLLLDEVAAFFSHQNQSISKNAIECLDPFLKFVLLDPKDSAHYTMLKTLLKATLVDSVTWITDRNFKNTCFAYLIQMISKMQLSTRGQVGEVTHFCVQLLSAYQSQISSIDDDLGERLGTFAVGLMLKNQRHQLGIVTVCKKLLEIAKEKPQVLANDYNLTVLSELILTVYPSDNIYILNIVKLILKTSSTLSPLCCGFANMGAINLVASRTTHNMPYHKTLVTLATDAIAQLQRAETVASDKHVEKVQLTSLQSQEIYTSQVMVQLARTFADDSSMLEQWLGHLKHTIQSTTNVPLNLTNLLVAILIQTDETRIFKLVVSRISEIAKQQPSQAPSFLPVFLFSLNKKTSPEQKLCIMEALPSLATHKYCVPPVLKVIQSLGLNPKLKGLTIKLLTDLWKLQSRCFPMLLNAITEDIPGNQRVAMTTQSNDVIIAKAAAIKEICQLKPEQHGTEVLAPLSHILDTCIDERGGPAAALALEALYYICQAEVIDIVSTWKVLEDKLLKETRPAVIEKICDLLSLVPQLPASSQAYQEFLEQTVRMLWLYSQSENPKVVIAAFQSLSNFGTEHFKLSHFKYKIVEEFVLQAQTALEQNEDNKGETLDSVITMPPGVCYIRLLQDQEKTTLSGYESFLSSMVGKEFDNLPRGIYYSSTRRHGSSARLGKAVASVPGLIQTQYENTNQPGLRPGLAAGLLFCYDPPVPVSRDGRPRLHYTMSHGKNYQQMFQALLNDVAIPATDWHMLALMPMAWSLFIERLFGSMVMARKAEIDLQKNRDFLDETEAEEKKVEAWLWVRDTIIDVIKRSSKGNPSVQANAILALAGLVSASHRYVVSLDREERRHLDDVTDHMTHSHWTMTVIDSCLSIVDFTYKPKSPLIGLCQQRSVDDRLPASILAQAAGILALSQLVPVLVSHYVETVYIILDKLIGWLPGQPDDDECPPVLHLSRGIALGKFLAKLVNESFADMEASKGSLAVMKGFDAIEKCCFSQSPHRVGAMIGLGICLSALTQDGKTDSRVHVVSVLNTMLDHLKCLQPTDNVYQVCCTSVAMVTSAGFSSNGVEIELVDKVLNHLQEEVHDNNQDIGAALSLGILCHSLVIGGHPNVAAISQSVYSDWMKLSHDKDALPMVKLAAITGLMAITGSEKLLIAMNDASADLPADIKVDTVIKTACQIMTSTDDVITQGSAAWLLGNFYLSLNASPQSSSTVPVNYSYLPETSILRAIVDFLLLASKQGPETIASEEVAVCLKALEEEVTGSLPPLNWTGVLSPHLKLPFGEEVKIQCISLAIKQCMTSSTAAIFISSWCVPPLFNTLSESCQRIILTNSDVLMKSVTPTTFQNFLDKSCYPMIPHNSQGKSLRAAALKGLNSALAVTDPPESTVSMLYKMITKVFGELKAESDTGVLQILSECLSQVPVQIFDDITNGDCTDNQSILRGTFIRSYLVGGGKQPIALLNSCIDAAFNNDCDHESVLYYLSLCFYVMPQTQSVHTRVMQRVQWLLEIMGHIRNIATGTYPVKLPTDKVIEFAVNIVAAAICGWTNKISAGVLDLDLTLFKPLSRSQQGDLDQGRTGCKLILQPLGYLTCCIGCFENEPWSQILAKMIDWLLTMIELPEAVISREIKDVFKDCVHGLRSTPDYCKVAVWTRAVQQT